MESKRAHAPQAESGQQPVKLRDIFTALGKQAYRLTAVRPSFDRSFRVQGSSGLPGTRYGWDIGPAEVGAVPSDRLRWAVLSSGEGALYTLGSEGAGGAIVVGNQQVLITEGLSDEEATASLAELGLPAGDEPRRALVEHFARVATSFMAEIIETGQ